MAITTSYRSVLAAAGMGLVALATLWIAPPGAPAADDDKKDYDWAKPKNEVLVKDVKDEDTVEVKGNTWRFNGAVLPKNKYYRLTTSPGMNEYLPQKDVIVVSFHISEVVSYERTGEEGGKDSLNGQGDVFCKIVGACATPSWRRGRPRRRARPPRAGSGTVTAGAARRAGPAPPACG
jgi:hypothetical protein